MYSDEAYWNSTRCVRVPQVSKQAPGVFNFRKHRQRIDWKQLASVDIDQIVRDVDISLLQNNLANVTFCDIQSEIGQDLDPSFVKVFRLAQLTIEYLLHSQECLSSALSRTEQQYSKVKQKVYSKPQNGKHVTVNAKRRKSSTSPVVLADFTKGHQCVHCQKLFMSNMYLDMHLLRRHQDRLPSDAPKVENSKDELIKELREFKVQLASSQLILNEKHKAAKDLVGESELIEVRDMLLKELTSVDGKCRSMEKELNLLKHTAEIKSDVVVNHASEEEAAFALLVQKQIQAIEQLKLQMSNLKAGIKRKGHAVDHVTAPSSNRIEVSTAPRLGENVPIQTSSDVTSSGPSNSNSFVESIPNTGVFRDVPDPMQHLPIQTNGTKIIQVKTNPSILPGTQLESQAVSDRLGKIADISVGVDHRFDSTLSKKLSNQREAREIHSKKHVGLEPIWEQLNSKLTKLSSVYKEKFVDEH